MSARRHLLRVDRPADAFAGLFRAAAAAGLRIGWLELEAPEVVPPTLEAAADLGALRAVAVGGGRSVAVKPMRGAPVLGDVLGEHFRGCALVLVRGDVEAARLRPEGEGWHIVSVGEGKAGVWETKTLLGALAKPRPPWCR